MRRYPCGADADCGEGRLGVGPTPLVVDPGARQAGGGRLSVQTSSGFGEGYMWGMRGAAECSKSGWQICRLIIQPIDRL